MRSPRSASAGAAIALGLGAAVSSVLGIADTSPWQFIALDGVGTLVLLALAASAVVAGLLARPGLIALAGAGFVAAAVLQLVQLAWTDSNLLGGNGSTLSLLLGFGVGLLAVALTPASPTAAGPAAVPAHPHPEGSPADDS